MAEMFLAPSANPSNGLALLSGSFVPKQYGSSFKISRGKTLGSNL